MTGTQKFVQCRSQPRACWTIEHEAGWIFVQSQSNLSVLSKVKTHPAVNVTFGRKSQQKKFNLDENFLQSTLFSQNNGNSNNKFADKSRNSAQNSMKLMTDMFTFRPSLRQHSSQPFLASTQPAGETLLLLMVDFQSIRYRPTELYF